jgi:hypothetical protein
MANDLTNSIGEVWADSVQPFLENSLVAVPLSTVKRFSPKDGNTLNFPYTAPQRHQAYTPGTDLEIDTVDDTANTLVVSQRRSSTMVVDSVQQSQVSTQWVAKQAASAAYSLRNYIDQYVLGKGVTGANSGNTVTGGTLSASNILSTLSTARARLSEANGDNGTLFAVGSPGIRSLLTQSQIANTFNDADTAYRNGFVGNVSGFKFYESNNLPSSVTLTVDTEPTATNTFTIKGVTFTFVAAGTAAAAGEISLDAGGTVTDTQLVIVDAINGTGTPGVSTYIELAAEDRRRLQNAQVSAAAFGTNASVITANGLINASETFTAATNVFGTETSQILCGTVGAISMGISKDLFTDIREESKQHAVNYLTTVFFDATVFHRDTYKLSKITHNAV